MNQIILFVLVALTSFVALADRPIMTSGDMDALVPRDRQAYVDELRRADGASCTTADGGESTCGVISNIPNGDSSFSNQFYRHIPQPTAISVETTCNPQDKRFYTTVKYQDASGNWRDFQCPLSRESNWVTSPGLYNNQEEGRPVGRYRTPNFQAQRGRGFITEWHRVSDGAIARWGENPEEVNYRMPWTVWVQGSYAYHASNEATGYPASHGCLRLSNDNAHCLFMLMRRAGTAQAAFTFNGYGPSDRNGRPACSYTKEEVEGGAAPAQASAEETEANSTRTRRNVFQRFGSWLSRTFGGRRSSQPEAVDR